MKTEDLMIGDWVKFMGDGEPKPMKVIEITMLNQVGLWDFDKNDYIVVGEKYIQPIQLTEEILKKNGFKTDGKNLILHYTDNIHETALYLSEMYMADPPGYVTGTPNLLMEERPCNIDVFGVIHYVHDLQHLYKFKKINKEIIL